VRNRSHGERGEAANGAEESNEDAANGLQNIHTRVSRI
jgi:hypothetical protein